MTWTPPDTWWCVNTEHESFRVDEATAAAIVHAMATRSHPLVTFVDILGSRTTIRTADIESVWDCTADVRERSRAISGMLDDESGPEWQRA